MYVTLPEVAGFAFDVNSVEVFEGLDEEGGVAGGEDGGLGGGEYICMVSS
jgi:hypothetical protein